MRSKLVATAAFGVAVLSLVGGCGSSQPAAKAPAGGLSGITVPAKGKSPTIDAIRKAGVITVGVGVLAPWELQDPSTGNYTGPAITLAKDIGKALGVKVQFVATEASNIAVAGLQSNKFELTVAPLYETPQRAQVVNFVTWTSDGTCYFAKKSNNKVTTLSSLDNSNVSFVLYAGTGTQQAVEGKYTKAKFNVVEAPPSGLPPFNEVLAGRGDVGTIDASLAFYVAKQYPTLKIIPAPAACIAHPDLQLPIGMAVNKGDPAFVSFLKSVVTKEQPTINALLKKYSSPKYVHY